MIVLAPRHTEVVTMFSVLLSVYHKDDPSHLDGALDSLCASVIPIPEVVIVEDWPVNPSLAEVIDRYTERLPIVRITLTRSTSLGDALNVGLQRCSHRLVARFDSDDLIEPDRFRAQLAAFEEDPGLDLLGSAIDEFESDPDAPYAHRAVPLRHDQIVAYAKRRNPFNHMTVMYRKEAVLRVHGYAPRIKHEDYDLWVRMLQAGAKATNLPVALVRARAGKAMARRRGGWLCVRTEYAIQRRFLASGFISRTEFVRNLLVRGTLQLIPSFLRFPVYRFLLRRRVDERGAPRRGSRELGVSTRRNAA